MKQNAQTQDADGRQAFFSDICDTFKGHISTSIISVGGSEPLSLYVLPEAPAKRRATFWDLNCLISPVACTLWSFFFYNVTLNLHISFVLNKIESFIRGIISMFYSNVLVWCHIDMQTWTIEKRNVLNYFSHNQWTNIETQTTVFDNLIIDLGNSQRLKISQRL